ncbi:MAG TPA: NADH-quinone oxidoreductase subunit H [Myxococcota bacterium]
MSAASLIPPLVGLAAAPLFVGLIAKLKARAVGRQGPPLVQPYRDLLRSLRKGAVYSRDTTWVFRAGPLLSALSAAAALFLIPAAGLAAPVAFAGDFLLLAYLLALGRVFTVLAALDTGSSFEGMGASRELLVSTLAEPALFLVLLTLVTRTGELSLSAILAPGGAAGGLHAAAPLALAIGALVLLLLAENSRVPVDDPTTHLELTMIHEVMVLDHGGPDLALIDYGAALKLWAFAALTVGIALAPGEWSPAAGAALFLAGMIAVAALVAVIESSMARLRLTRLPQFLVVAAVLAGFSLLLSIF